MSSSVGADGNCVSSPPVVTKLFKKEFVTECADMNGKEIFQSLEKLLNTFRKNKHGKAVLRHSRNGKHYFIVICTPVMLRVHERIVQSSELVILHAYGEVDKHTHRVYFLVTPSAAGDLPLGIIITDTEKEAVFSESIKCYKNLVGESAFYYKTEPQIFLIDNLKENFAVGRTFPASRKLLCHFHMLKSIWSWLQNSKQEIRKEHRQEAYFKFKELLYSVDEGSAFVHLNSLISYAKENEYENLVHHVNELWKRKQMWVNCYRHTIPIHGNNSKSYVEVVYRVIVDSILEKVLKFNLIELVDFVLTPYELYMEQRLTDFSNGSYSSCRDLLKKMLPGKFDPREFCVHLDKENCYKVESTKTKEWYTVDLERGVCSCTPGTSGNLCKHSSAVIISLENGVRTEYSLASPKIKEDIFYVAQGILPPPEWYLNLGEDVDNPYMFEKYETGLFEETEDDTQEYDNDMEGVNVTEEKKLVCAKTKENILNASQEIVPDSNCFLFISDKDDGNSCASEKFETWPNFLEEKMKSKKRGHDSDTENVNFAAEDIITLEEQQQLEDIFARIKEGLKSNTEVFIPAVRKFLQNEKTFAKTEVGLVSALQNFGKQHRCHKFQKGVQSEASAERKSLLASGEKICAGQSIGQQEILKELMEHDYTTFGALFSRKGRASDQL